MTPPASALLAETLTLETTDGVRMPAFLAHPLDRGSAPGVVVLHHGLGWDGWSREVVLRFASVGFAALCPNLDSRAGDGEPDDVAARVRAAGWFPDATVISDVHSAVAFLLRQPFTNGRVGLIGFCSGGRYTYLAAGQLSGIDAAVDCWGGDIVIDDPKRLTDKRPVAPIDYTERITAPLLGIFGNEDSNPTTAQVDHLERTLKAAGKRYEFHRYDGAGHAFLFTRSSRYRPEQAEDAWRRILDFLTSALGSGAVWRA